MNTLKTLRHLALPLAALTLHIARALLAAGVAEAAIEQIPDEQQAIDAALRMGRPGDLLLVFADALARSWKQITKFTPDGAVPRGDRQVELPSLEPTLSADEAAVAAMEGVVREERGLVFARHDEGSD